MVQNKILPGVYQNFSSVAQASATLSDRGTAAIAMMLSWGPQGEVFRVESGDLITDSQTIFGCAYTADELIPVREIFCHAKTVYFYRLNDSSATKASNDFATAKYAGTAGNNVRIVITSNEKSGKEKPPYDVATYLGTKQMDIQEGIESMADLEDNDFVTWKDDATIALTASMPLEGGTDGAESDGEHQSFLDAIESYSVNAVGCVSDDTTIKQLYVAWVKRMRDEVGKKTQVALADYPDADYEGVVSIKNKVENGTTGAELVPWLTGVVAGTAVNKSATALEYDGDYTVITKYTQTQLEECITEGSFVLHNDDGDTVVLSDINTFTSTTVYKSADFSSNQVIRVLDQIANDTAVTFKEHYLGKVQNEATGRQALWSDIVKLHEQLQTIKAIQNFEAEDITIAQGDTKTSVYVTDSVTPVCAMEKLYMDVYVE